MTELEEVVITGKSLKQEEIEERTRLYSNPSNRLILDSLAFVSAANSIFDLLLQVPGVAISGFFPNQSASIRGFPGAPIYLIDGMPVDVEFIQSLPVQDVEFIDVLKGPEAAVFGSRGGGGAILVSFSFLSVISDFDYLEFFNMTRCKFRSSPLQTSLSQNDPLEIET